MGREAVASYQLFSEEAVDLARFAQEELDPKAVVVTDARHNNELAALAGQNLLCGSPSTCTTTAWTTPGTRPPPRPF